MVVRDVEVAGRRQVLPLRQAVRRGGRRRGGAGGDFGRGEGVGRGVGGDQVHLRIGRRSTQVEREAEAAGRQRRRVDREHLVAAGRGVVDGDEVPFRRARHGDGEVPLVAVGVRVQHPVGQGIARRRLRHAAQLAGSRVERQPGQRRLQRVAQRRVAAGGRRQRQAHGVPHREGQVVQPLRKPRRGVGRRRLLHRDAEVEHGHVGTVVVGVRDLVAHGVVAGRGGRARKLERVAAEGQPRRQLRPQRVGESPFAAGRERQPKRYRLPQRPGLVGHAIGKARYGVDSHRLRLRLRRRRRRAPAASRGEGHSRHHEQQPRPVQPGTRKTKTCHLPRMLYVPHERVNERPVQKRGARGGVVSGAAH